jgi:hypothetical protein
MGVHYPINIRILFQFAKNAHKSVCPRSTCTISKPKIPLAYNNAYLPANYMLTLSALFMLLFLFFYISAYTTPSSSNSNRLYLVQMVTNRNASFQSCEPTVIYNATSVTYESGGETTLCLGLQKGLSVATLFHFSDIRLTL